MTIERSILAAKKGSGPSDPDFSKVVLLLHGDATPFTDSSSIGNTITNSAATLDTTTKKFGAGSINLSSASSATLSMSTGSALSLTGDFTIETWVNITSNTSYPGIFSNGEYNSSCQVYAGFGATSNPVLYMGSPAGWGLSLTTSSSIGTGTWTHIAYTASGTTFSIWVNGTQAATQTASFTRVNPSATTVIGKAYPAQNLYYLDGKLDDLRVTKGLARYTSTFTVPSSAFPDK